MVTDSTRSKEIEEKRKFWQQHLTYWQESGLSQAEDCRQNNLNKYQWGYWKKRYVKTESTTEFIPLNMNQAFGLSSRSPLKLIVNE